MFKCIGSAHGAAKPEKIMHTNPRFNILQAQGNCNPLFVVIEGRRSDSGNMEHGGKVLTKPMSRDDAIKLADKMEAEIAA